MAWLKTLHVVAVTLHNDSTLLREMICDMISSSWNVGYMNKYILARSKVIINGDLRIGYSIDPSKLVTQVRIWRRNFQVHPHTSVCWDNVEGCIYLFTDRGRCIRPLLVNSENLQRCLFLKSRGLKYLWMNR